MSQSPKLHSTADLISGAFVALIALPLSMGISVASGFPPIAGVLTAIVGGLVTGILGGSRLTVKGPAAGMIVIVLSAVMDFREIVPEPAVVPLVIAVVVVAGFCQVLLGIARLASLAERIPSSVIHGMLAAIGIIIIGKQIHLVLGVIPEISHPIGLYLEIPHSLQAINPAVAFIGIISFLVMILWARVPFRPVRAIPNSLVVVVTATVCALVLDMRHAHAYSLFGARYLLDPSLLIAIPSNVFHELRFPDWTALSMLSFWKHVFIFTIVGSIESVLTVAAVDSITKQKDRADLNRDLIAVGCGNMIAGCIGGLPMISEIVRSKANIDFGARTLWANWYHGLFLLAAIFLFPSLLRNIPVAALAGILVYVGTRLVSPQEFKHMWELGRDQLFFFLLTVILTVSVDLLVGVIAGLLAYALFALIHTRDLKNVCSLRYTSVIEGDSAKLTIQGSALFSNVHGALAWLADLPTSCRMVRFDFSQVSFVDHSFLLRIVMERQRYADREIRLEGLDADCRAFSSHELATRVRKLSAESTVFDTL
jgi:MFS superfamily sulfate permease-like transporter